MKLKACVSGRPPVSSRTSRRYDRLVSRLALTALLGSSLTLAGTGCEFDSSIKPEAGADAVVRDSAMAIPDARRDGETPLADAGHPASMDAQTGSPEGGGDATAGAHSSVAGTYANAGTNATAGTSVDTAGANAHAGTNAAAGTWAGTGGAIATGGANAAAGTSGASGSAGQAGDGTSGAAGSQAGVGGDPSGANDAGAPDDSCELDVDAGTPASEMFTVPTSGGAFEFCSASGIVRFTFPAALAGLQVTVTVVDPLTFSWPHHQFAGAMLDALRLEASASLTQPVRIRLPYGRLFGFVFSEHSSVPLPLRRSQDQNSLELSSTGTIGIVAPEHSCESTPGGSFTNGWRDEPASGMCSGALAKSTWRHYECDNRPFCYDIRSWCCVYPGDTRGDCRIEDVIYYDRFYRENAGPYAYCDGIGDSPYLQSVTPSTLVANYMDQTITLTGNQFPQDGGVFAGRGEYSWSSGYVIDSSWSSATSASAVISGRQLEGVAEIWIGYAERGFLDRNDWSRSISNMLRIPVTAPAVVCPVPGVGSNGGSCTSLPNGCQCSVAFDPGDGPHTYSMTCNTSECSCTRDGAVVVTAPRSNACNSDNATIEQWKISCLSTAGFCP